MIRSEVRLDARGVERGIKRSGVEGRGGLVRGSGVVKVRGGFRAELVPLALLVLSDSLCGGGLVEEGKWDGGARRTFEPGEVGRRGGEGGLERAEVDGRSLALASLGLGLEPKSGGHRVEDEKLVRARAALVLDQNAGHSLSVSDVSLARSPYPSKALSDPSYDVDLSRQGSLHRQSLQHRDSRPKAG